MLILLSGMFYMQLQPVFQIQAKAYFHEQVISEIMNGERDSGGVHVISTKGAFIETEKPVRWTIDGEFGGETDRVSFGVLHDAVEFIVKKEE